MGETVTVACKIPNGLVLRLFHPVKMTEPVLGGGVREFTMHVPVEGVSHTLVGPAAPFGERPKVPVVAGYAINAECPKEIVDEWFKQNKDSMLVKNNMVMAYPKRDSVVSAAKEHRTQMSGLEPLRPDDTVMRNGRKVSSDPRVPRGIEKATNKQPETD